MGTALLTLLLTLLALAAAVPPASAAPRDDAGDAPADRAVYLAERLRENPVYISDQVPRVAPLSSAPDFRKQAARTGVPTYVVLLPGQTVLSDRQGLLAQLHDRLGRDGLYILLEDGSAGLRAETYGVDVPAEQAARATLYELTYDAGPLQQLTRFVDVLKAGDREAARRARAAAEDDSGSEPERLHPSRTDREDQSFLAGILLTAVPLLVASAGLLLRRSRLGRWVRLRFTLPAAVLAFFVLLVGLPMHYDDTRSSDDPPPSGRDLTARTERVAAALREEALYEDPESARRLSPKQKRSLSRRIEDLRVPVRVAVVPLTLNDESGGDGDYFARQLHRATGEDALYVVAQPDAMRVHVVNYGARLDDGRLYRYTEKIRYGSSTGDDDRPDLYEKLGELVGHIADVPSGPPGKPYLEPLPPDDPVEEDRLPPLYSGGELGGGLTLGAMGAVVLVGCVSAGYAVFGSVRSHRSVSRQTPRTALSGPGASGARNAPAKPGAGWLRRTARRELHTLNEEFREKSGDASPVHRERTWKCLDAATLLLDQEGDGRVDADADAPTLATALVALRAGQAALRAGLSKARKEEAARICSLNPLHGPAAGRSTFSREGQSAARSQPVCARCRTFLSGPGAGESAVNSRLLRLRARRGTPYVPYDQVPGPLSGTGACDITTDHLVDDVLEYLGVH